MSNSDKVQLVRVLEPQQGQRLDNFLIRQLKGVPRSRVYRLIRRGEVRVNKKRAKPDRKLECGDEVRIPPFKGPADSTSAKVSPGLEKLLVDRVLLENELLLVINKPAGIAVHGGSGIRLGLIEAMRQIKPGWRELELAHRLDRDTSGCLVLAKDTKFLKHIQRELKERRVTKQYLALVHGAWPDNIDVIDAPLLKSELDSGEGIVRVREEGKAAITRFKVRQRFEQATLVEAMPETGRTHQIRVHCQHAGHAIVGDTKYTARSPSAQLAKVKYLCLHASKIEFTAADQKQVIAVAAPTDKYLLGLLQRLK